MDYSDAYLKSILDDVKTVAMVGVSANVVRPSYFVGRYLGLKGYKVHADKPGLRRASTSVWRERYYKSLKSTSQDQARTIHMVDIFRRSEEAGSVVDEALDHLLDRGLKVDLDANWGR